LLDVIHGKDEKDSISLESKDIDLGKLHDVPRNITIGILDLKISDKRIKEMIDKKISELEKKYGWKTKKIKIDLIELAVETYYPLVYTEFFSGTRKFDGRLYGQKIENSCGPEVLRRILGGSEITKEEFGGRYYNRALKAKKLVEEEFAKAFKEVDCIILPTVPRLPWKIGEKISVEEAYAADILTIPANLAGYCAISVPSGIIDNTENRKFSVPQTSRSQEVRGLPVGIQIMCNKFQEQKLFEIATAVERLN
jgi:aspartyl-tRNA(Asn)/glutamyl-tRNA(Gln) amidotransferase subunit A